MSRVYILTSIVVTCQCVYDVPCHILSLSRCCHYVVSIAMDSAHTLTLLQVAGP